jgi:hypothetical protein
MQSELIDESADLDDSSNPNYIGTTTIQNEGSCEFLLQCSVYSRNRGVVSWACGGTGCDNSERWVAVPDWRDHMCGETVTLCRGSVCTEAKVKDVSCCDRWEASPSVLDDLGVGNASYPNTCSGYGEARVAIYRGSASGTFGGGGGGGSSDTIFCTDPGGSCGGNSPCWADCPSGSSCDYAQGSWGTCR